jgi:(p)ppGpp synthase/HD superfamily hydrolase
MSERTQTPTLSGQFSKALVYAELKHHNQVRKGGDIPYVGHLLSVASLVINDGGSEAQAIAALLHDCVEDAGGPPTLAEITDNFGTEVARIVAQCSDTDEVPKPPWRERKQRYIAHLDTVGQDTLLVSVADKLDNARAMLRDHRTHGAQLWQRFTVSDPADHLWYYGRLIAAYRRRGLDSWMVDELGRVIDELSAAAVMV